MRRRTRSALILALALVAGCDRPSAPPRQAGADVAALAIQALDAGDWTKAAALYRQALAAGRDEIALHYGLATAASHLGEQGEAIREFQRVLAQAPADSPEARTARRWLSQVGALPAPVRPDTQTDEPSAASTASVEGRVVSVDDPHGAPLKRQQLFLVEQPNRTHQYRVRTDEDGRYRFVGVVPGVYQLTDRIAGPPLWRLRVETREGRVVFVDLGPGNSTRTRDDFPEQAGADYPAKRGRRFSRNARMASRGSSVA